MNSASPEDEFLILLDELIHKGECNMTDNLEPLPMGEELPPPPKKKNTGLIIGIVVAVVLCCCCIAAIILGVSFWPQIQYSLGF